MRNRPAHSFALTPEGDSKRTQRLRSWFFLGQHGLTRGLEFQQLVEVGVEVLLSLCS